jgi:SAM-dependent methyltransferase
MVDLEAPRTLSAVLELVRDNTVYECALPPLFQTAMDQGYIEWVFVGPAGRDWLGLTDKGREALPTMTLSQHYAGWNTPQHVEHFDLWNRQNDALFRFGYGAFQEVRYLLDAIGKAPGSSVLDVGSATGTTYRYLALERARFDYTGTDLSEPAIVRAKQLHPKGRFIAKGPEPLAAFFDRRFDIVFSRDTIMHQTDPMAFIGDLASVASKALIVRLRTRDQGATVYDVEQSCQMHYDEHWMPYIVLNFDELIDRLRELPGAARITANRSYEVLGGSTLRYLPKELYYRNAGGAETAVMVDFSADTAAPEIVTTATLEGRPLIKSQRVRYAALRVLNKISGEGSR